MTVAPSKPEWAPVEIVNVTIRLVAIEVDGCIKVRLSIWEKHFSNESSH